jgi:hypothetical protein
VIAFGVAHCGGAEAALHSVDVQTAPRRVVLRFVLPSQEEHVKIRITYCVQ